MKTGCRLFLRLAQFAFALLVLLLLLPHWFKRSEQVLEGVDFRSGLLPIRSGGAQLLVDETGYDPASDERVIRQEIFDHMLDMVQGASRLILADFFLWNDWQGAVPEEYRNLSDELADALIQRKQEIPELDVLVITDPINRMYGASLPEPFARMRRAGIFIVFTNLDALPDSNGVYSPYARFYGGLLSGVPFVRAWLERPRWLNPLQASGERFSALQWGRLLFFKANHRKVLIADTEGGSGLRLVVGSLNPADGSSAHCNIGLQLDGALAAAALKNELAIPAWSPSYLETETSALPAMMERMKQVADEFARNGAAAGAGDICGEWLTEQAVRNRIIEMLEEAGAGDEVRVGLFYLSDRGVVDALVRAATEGASVRLLLDANKDAFGRTKNGVPNRPAAAELLRRTKGVRGSLAVRWADTKGEQYHAKAMSISNPEKNRWLFIAGSANWTRRNLAGFNLEADAYIENDRALNEHFNRYFDAAWSNEGGLLRTAAVAKYADRGFAAWWKPHLYRFQEATGAGTF